MAFDRPTYDESWHRIADTRPRLRATIQCVRQRFRGRTWHVLLDPSSNQHFRLNDAGYRFLGLLDGRRTVAESWETTQQQLGDRAPTQGEALRLLGQLHTSNLLDSDLSPDSKRLFDRQRKRVRREAGSYAKNIMFLRVPLWDPDRFLDRWTPAVGWAFGPLGVTLWFLLLGFGGWSLLGRGDQLVNQSGHVLAPQNLPWLYACFVGTKALHELGHAFACKRFGRRRHGEGEVHTVGLMLMVLTPVPYVDATSAWALPSKWQRAFVGAAGMYVELAVAAVAAVVWSRTAPDTLAHVLAYNVVFIAGVSTVLFNANPLIKFDGYYILSDLIEVPNLNQRATRYLTHLVKRFAYGVRNLTSPAHTAGERLWFVTYGLAALAYRVFLGVVIVLFVADKLFFIGALMALMALFGYLVIPLAKLAHYLTASPEPARVRGRAVLATAAMAAFPLALLAYAPMPDRPRADGVLEPHTQTDLHAPVEGFVVHLLPARTPVRRGELLARAQNPRLEARVHELRALHRELQTRYQQAITQEPVQQQALVQQLAATAELLAQARQDVADLEVTAPTDGWWYPALDDTARGHYLERGRLVGTLVADARPVVRVAADQFEGPRLADADPRVRVRFVGQPDSDFAGRIVRILPAGQRRLPSPALGQAAGGPIATDPADPEGRLAAEPFFAFTIEPETPGAAPDPAVRILTASHPLRAVDAAVPLQGQRVVVRFSLPDQPLLQQWVRAARQALQQRFQLPADPDASPLGGLGL
ncbi:MAG: PqqD family peptide modification chaperone [Planctomycetota bacterium]